jgi:hypothetical protein
MWGRERNSPGSGHVATLKKPHWLAGIGAGLMVLTSLWWYAELVGRLGDNVTFAGSLSCLVELATGSCGYLLFAGMHLQNVIAALSFYAGLATLCGGMFLLGRDR